MKTKSVSTKKNTKVSRIVDEATRAYQNGSCLKAGQLIDHAYRQIGRRMVPKALKKLDETFERTCVRKHPR